MSRTLNQQMGDAHERDIAEWTGGRQPKASGSQWHDPLDVKNDTRTVYPLGNDGKATLGKSLGITREMWKKLREECFGHIPAWWGRFYQDESLRTVHLDLVALEKDDFLPIWEDAKKWKAIEEEFGYEGVLEAVDVINLMRAARDHELRQHPAELVEIRLPVKTGCDCCR